MQNTTSRRLLGTMAVLGTFALLAGCSAPPADSPSTKPAESDFLPCMVSDTGGFNDHSFNQSAYDAIQEAAKDLNSKFIAVESHAETDYESNVNGLVDQGCNLIVTVGFLLAPATVKAALANPDVNFAIIDNDADLDFDGKPDAPNIKPMLFDVAPATFLAGYAAASYTKTGVIGTFAGMNIPPVTIFLDGFAEGIKYYNSVKGTDVKLLGWDEEKQDGLAIGSFVAGTEALTASQNLIAQGADIIESGGGTTFISIISAFQDAGVVPVLIGGDSDMYFADPENADTYLISAMKGTKVATVDVIEKTATSGFDNTPYIGTLANDGVGISPFHDFESKVDPSLQGELDAIKQKIISGEIKVNSPSSPK
ncbi:MAG: BMP family ABC transporter substrate-binding protein [Homoserinimonas sp.]|nr:BMP family ABC transporter substrate-binding protein [Homoserinimonas sp.]